MHLEDDEFNIFSRYDKGAMSVGKGSAKFAQKDDQVEKISIQNHSEVQTFGQRNGEDRVSKSPLGDGGPVVRQEYSSFKQNSKYNKYVKEGQGVRQPPGPKDLIGLDTQARSILKNDDMGEVAEWTGMSLNKKKMADDQDQDDDGGFGYNGNPKASKKNDDDEFDFEDAPTVPKVFNGEADSNMDALRQKALKKLENPGMKIGTGGGPGGLANRLANKQKELNEKQRTESSGDRMYAPPNGLQNQAREPTGTNSQTGSGLLELSASFGPRVTQEFSQPVSTTTNAQSAQQNKDADATNPRFGIGQPRASLPSAQKKISFGRDEDEWDQVNFENRNLVAAPVRADLRPVEAKTWEEAWNTLRVEDYSKFKNEIVTEEPKTFFQKMFGCLSPTIEQTRKKEKEIVYSLAKLQFDNQSELHRGLLQGIYLHFYPNSDCPATGNHWRKVGFQSEDPNRDFRSTGVLGPLQVACLIHRHPEWTKEIHLWSLDDKHNFPFIVNQFSLSKLSLDMFRLAKLNGFANKRPGFMSAFDDLYCAATILFFARYQTEGHTVATFGTLQQRIEEEVKADPNRIVERYLSCRLEISIPIVKMLTSDI